MSWMTTKQKNARKRRELEIKKMREAHDARVAEEARKK